MYLPIGFVLLILLAVPQLLAQTRLSSDAPQNGKERLQTGNTNMPGRISQEKVLADARNFIARNNIKGTRVAATQQSVEQYRDDLVAILAAQRATLVGFNLPGTERIDAVSASLQAMTTEDLLKLKDVADLSALKTLIVQQSLVISRSVELHKRELIQRQQRLSAAKAAGLYPGSFPEAQYSVLCPLNPQPNEALFAAGVIFVAAELVAALANVGCSQEVFGTNGKLVCIITEVIRSAAAFAHFYVEFCAENTDAGAIVGTYQRLEYIKDQLEFSIQNDNNNKAMLSTQLSNAENHIVTNDNNNLATLTGQAASALTLRVRQAVEANLASDLTTIAGVSLFQLPASRGGYLEVARQLLIDTYNAHVAAAGTGVVIYNPSGELSLGATYTTQGKYREAYYQYRRGYRSVVKFP